MRKMTRKAKRVLTRIAMFALAIIIGMFSLSACGQSGPTWQEQYDLGVRYLSEGNYEEAIIAFTAAIEIDPKRPEAYAKAAEAYEALEDYKSAVAILEKGYAETEDAQLLSEMGDGLPADEDILSHAVQYGSFWYIENAYVFQNDIPDGSDFHLYGTYDFGTMDTSTILQIFPNATGPEDSHLVSYSDGIRQEMDTLICYEMSAESVDYIWKSTQYKDDRYLDCLSFGDDDWLNAGYETGVFGLALGMSYEEVMERLGFLSEAIEALKPFKKIKCYANGINCYDAPSVSSIHRSVDIVFEEEGYSVQMVFNTAEQLQEVDYFRHN